MMRKIKIKPFRLLFTSRTLCTSGNFLKMKKIILIQCVKKKLTKLAKAKDLYISPLFQKSLAYAYMLNPDKMFILSAKHNLLSLNRRVSPYDLTLNEMSVEDIKAWSKKVIEELRKETNLNKDEFIFLAGENYRKFLIPEIKHYKIPMKGLVFGKQLKFLTENLR